MDYETKQLITATLGIYVAASIFIGSFIALCVKCFILSDGKDYPRISILLGNWLVVMQFIRNENLGRKLRGYFVAIGFGFFALTLSALGYVSASNETTLNQKNEPASDNTRSEAAHF